MALSADENHVRREHVSELLHLESRWRTNEVGAEEEKLEIVAPGAL
jgi:hypothetical protein